MPKDQPTDSPTTDEPVTEEGQEEQQEPQTEELVQEETPKAPPTEERKSQDLPDETWEKRYKDSQAEFNKKWKPIADKADHIAKLAGYDSIDKLYEEVQRAELAQAQEPAKTAPQQPAPKEEEEVDIAKKVEKVETYVKQEQRQKIDKEFEEFYKAYPEAKEQEPALTTLAKPLWNASDGKKFKYSRLRDALQDAWIIMNKETLVEKGKLQALAQAQQDQEATQSLLGGGSGKKLQEKAPIRLSPEEKRVAQQFIKKGVFANEQEYIESMTK